MRIPIFHKNQIRELRELSWWVKGFAAGSQDNCPFPREHIMALQDAISQCCRDIEDAEKEFAAVAPF